MITIEDIERKYCRRIPKKFRMKLGEYIQEKEVQAHLKKAMSYSLTETDYGEIYKIGNQSTGRYYGLYYVACIFIHPLTIAQSLLGKAERMLKRRV